MSELSKGVSDRIRITRVVTRSIAENGAEVAARQGEATDGARDGAFAATALAYHQGQAGLLERVTAALEAAELALSAERADDASARAARDEADQALRQALLRARAGITSGYGAKASERAGLADALPSGEDALALYGKNAASLLAEGAAGAPIDEAYAADIAAVSSRLNERAEALSVALSDVERERREEQTSLSARNAAMDRWAATYSSVAGSFATAARGVGLSEIADRVRPTARRRNGLLEPEDELAAAEESEVAAAEASAAAEEGEPSTSA